MKHMFKNQSEFIFGNKKKFLFEFFSARSRRGRTHGVALFELLIYVAVIGIAATVISGMFLFLGQGRSRVESSAEVGSQARFVMERIAADVRAASAVSAPLSTTTPSATLSVTTPEGVISYDVVGGIVRRTVGAGAPQPLTALPVSATSSSFARIENANTVFGKKTISVRADISFEYVTDVPEKEYSTRKTGAFPLRGRQ